MGNERRIFIAATRQNDGKTVVSLGLVMAMKESFGRVGFMKPVGQQYKLVEGLKVDKDAILLKGVCHLDDALEDMSPVPIEDGFTRRYLDSPDASPLAESIRNSYRRVARDRDIVVIEGTGHAGVGSVFDMCNADVARMLDAPVILVSVGGIGRPVDEIALNQALFEKRGVKVKGVIINKVIPEKRSVIEKYVGKAVARMGMKLFGCIPFTTFLALPSMSQICECVQGKVLAGENQMSQKVSDVLVGAMTARHALDYFKAGSLLVTPGDREDLILAVLSYCRLASDAVQPVVSGLLLTGGLYPHKSIQALIEKVGIPTVLAPQGTYEVASAIHELVAKIREEDLDKIHVARKLVTENVNIQEIFA